MPYSQSTELRKRLYNTLRKKAENVWEEAINYTYKEMYNEAWKMYDSFIDQFYEYSTKSYIRHGQSKPGTGIGINLYRGNNIRLKTGFTPSLNIEFNASDMESGYQYDSAETVLNNVMHGYRFPYFRPMYWEGKYNGKYFHYTGTPERAFYHFENQFNNIAIEIFRKKCKQLGW
ncbi:MAG: hypothetical protein KBT35_05895 [Firmicutes bacterium]|nr:hypothetical protein [Candidatus Colivicinus equi]